MSFIITEFPRQVCSFLSENAIAAAAIGTTVVLAVAGVAFRNYQMGVKAAKLAEAEVIRKQNEYLNSTEYKIKTLFEDLQIKEWYLPLPGGAVSVGEPIKKAPSPTFSKESTETVDKLIEMIKQAQENDQPLPNVILVGRTGVGKTTLAESLFDRTKIGFIRLPSGVMESHIANGTHITTLYKIFGIIEKCLGKVYLLMDDGEELVATRKVPEPPENDSTTKAYWLKEQQKTGDVIAQRRTAQVNTILEETGKDTRKVSLFITTNRPEVIDKAFSSRSINRPQVIDPQVIDPQVIDEAFSSRSLTINIEMPGVEERKAIIISHLPREFNNDLNYLDFFKKGRLEDMALKTEGFSGRDIVRMLKNILAYVKVKKGDITQEIVDASIFATKKLTKNLDSPAAAA